jgi:dihydrofolate synthase / folylpolyglutamate synthase
MTYPETLQFLFSQLPAYHRIGKAAYKNNLNNTVLLDNYFRQPHTRFHAVHIAGTNGKGSVSHMIASVLQEAGYKTGLYTSPHLNDFRERIKINGEEISEEEVISFVENHRGIISEIRPSFFEMTVAMAFNYFAQKAVDVAVVEVGLGGRLDSTNIIAPLLSVITNIGHDHMDLLGNTLEKVAIEKAGIIKQGVPVVIGETHPETQNVFNLKAESAHSQIVFADKTYKCAFLEDFSGLIMRKFKYTALKTNTQAEGITPLGGNYQIKNLQTVLTSCDLLKQHFKLSEVNVSEGIKNVIQNTGLRGRWQVLGTSPLTICDTGHNKEGLGYVLDQIADLNVKERHIIIGFVNDKDLSAVLQLFPKNAHYYFAKASVPRALDEKILRTEAAKYGLKGNSFHDVRSALENAKRNAEPDDLIFIGGSTFIVGDII